ncbi:MAG: D-glycerate dehydrogenase [Gemmatimonadetes bacterium]|nr:D-glycerate dehydrogenase [Gemmatimonadota bacterium]
MTNIFVTRRIPQVGLDILDRAAVSYDIGQNDEEKGCDRAHLLRAVRETDVLLSLLTDQVNRELLEANPKLRGVANHAVGFNNVDVAAATELGIPVSNTPGVLTETTADLTWALLLSIARRIPESEAYMRAGRYQIWGPNLLLGVDVGPGPDGRRKVLGIVGFGRIGQAVARRAAGFDMDVVAHDPNRAAVDAFPGARWASMGELLETADFVCLHPLLTPETHHLIDEAALRRMKPTAYLINVARGEVVHEAALVRALREHWIAGAALDVYEREPAVELGLLDLENAVLVPHIGSATKDTRDAMATIATTNALAHLKGERAPQCINPAVYETEAWRRRTQGARV